MQQPSQMLNIAPPFSLPPPTITTEQIQKYLDENKSLILSILENQNLGKLAECAEYQAQLQKNLMYLAAIADAQPPAGPAPTMPSQQMPPHPAGHQMQHPQAPTAQQQPGVFSPKLPFQLNPLQPQDQQQQQQLQQHLIHLQQQQLMQGHMGMRHGANNGMHHAMRTGVGASSGLVDARGSRQDGSEAGSGDGQGKSASGHGGGDREL